MKKKPTEKPKIDVYIQYYPRHNRYDYGLLDKTTKRINWRNGSYPLDIVKETIYKEFKNYDVTLNIS